MFSNKGRSKRSPHLSARSFDENTSLFSALKESEPLKAFGFQEQARKRAPNVACLEALARPSVTHTAAKGIYLEHCHVKPTFIRELQDCVNCKFNHEKPKSWTS